MKAQDSPKFKALRKQMVEHQLKPRGIGDSNILSAMLRVPRHLFVPLALRNKSYDDCALPLGPEQSISQPYIVALMLQSLQLRPTDRVLEIGTGSGYQAALLSELVGEVFSVEIDGVILEKAKKLLTALGCQNVFCREGDGFVGWEEKAPFDKITVSAAPKDIPRELVKQLRVGGRMILPLGEESQILVMLEKSEKGLESTDLGMVRFVPMRGRDPALSG